MEDAMSRFPMRYFRSAPDVYEQVRSTIDAAWGLPAHGQITALAPTSECPVADGLVYLSVRADHCEYPPVDTLLPQLIAAGQAEEITQADYLAACAAQPLP